MFKLNPSNPFKEYEGIYKIPVAINNETIIAAVKKLKLEIYKTKPKATIARQIVAVKNLHTATGTDTRLSRVLSLIGLEEADVAKILDTDVFKPDAFEYWQLTCEQSAFDTMGISSHFASCYSSGHYRVTANNIGKSNKACLIRQLNTKGGLKKRFVLAVGYNSYVGQREVFIKSDSPYRGTETDLFIANTKGQTQTKSLAIARALANNQAIKLTSEEVKTFKWPA